MFTLNLESKLNNTRTFKSLKKKINSHIITLGVDRYADIGAVQLWKHAKIINEYGALLHNMKQKNEHYQLL